MRRFKLPEWTKELPGHSNLMYKDIMAIFGYKGPSAAGCHINNGRLPEPDGSIGRGSGGRRAKNTWSLGYLRRLELEQDKE